MLEKAEHAEGSFEALIVELTSESRLTPGDCDCLAAFRLGYHSLREKIRSNQRLEWWTTTRGGEEQYRELRAFKALGEYFAFLLVRRPRWFLRRQPPADYAVRSLLRATSIHKDWVKMGEKLVGNFE